MIMSSTHFVSQTGVQLKTTFGAMKSSDALVGICKDLASLEGGKFPKFDPLARWDFMLKLAGKCEIYLKAKEAKGRSLGKPKHKCIDDLATQLITEMWRERFKSNMYGNKATQFDNVHAAVPMGRNNPHHGKVKFELALGGKSPVVNGQTLWNEAEKAGIKLTGNDHQDAYILRSWLKQMARENKLQQYSLTPLEYADSVRRARYLLSFDQATCSQGGAPFDTTRGFMEGEVGAGPFAISEGGEWYAKGGKISSDGSFHHSTFLSGAPVILAGSIRVANGTLQYISNASGHYSPTIADLLNGAKQLRHCGLDRAARHKVSIYAHDHENKYGRRACAYLFPYSTFVDTKGVVPNAANYSVVSKWSDLYWETPPAPRPHHRCTAAQDGQVVYPT